MGIRKCPFWHCVAATVTLAFALATAARCQQVSDVTLTIRFAGAQSRFHVGEIIRLDLVFRSSTPKTYEMSTRSYDRSGRLNLEQFHVSPPGRDPLHDYYDGGLFGGFIGGGLSSGPRYLGNKPEIIHEDLNEWVALDHPGQYALYVTTSRVRRRVGSKMPIVRLRSNTLYFDVVKADAAWQEQTLDNAMSVLDDPDSSPQRRSSASRTLRFLDSPGSVRELVREIGKPGNEDSWDCLAGLMGSTHRRLVVSELQAQLVASDTAITSAYITALAATRFLLTRKPLSVYPRQGKQQQGEWMARRADRMRKFQQAEDALYARAAAVAAAKKGRAKAETVETLLNFPQSGPSSPKPWKSLSGNTLASAFLLLPPSEQVSMLQARWERIKAPAMAAALENILDRPRIDNQQLRDVALGRLNELDPEEGAARIMEEIEQPHVDLLGSTVSAQTLDLLPNKTLPQFDSLLAARLAAKNSQTIFLDAQLIGRYSTKAILPRVKAVYMRAPGKWDCRIENGLMIYFLRVDPDFAVREMRGAPSLCAFDAYRMAVKMRRWPAVEPTIIPKLNDPNLQTARQAAEVLRRYGGRNAEKALWKRLEEFHAQWAKRASELQERPRMSNDDLNAIGLQTSLVDALGRAQGWLLTDDQLRRLKNLALGQEKSSVAQLQWKSPIELDFTFDFRGRFQTNVNGISYGGDLPSLCAKLAQFPSGTEFRVRGYGPQARLAPIWQALKHTASQHGLVLQFDKAR